MDKEERDKLLEKPWPAPTEETVVPEEIVMNSNTVPTAAKSPRVEKRILSQESKTS